MKKKMMMAVGFVAMTATAVLILYMRTPVIRLVPSANSDDGKCIFMGFDLDSDGIKWEKNVVYPCDAPCYLRKVYRLSAPYHGFSSVEVHGSRFARKADELIFKREVLDGYDKKDAASWIVKLCEAIQNDCGISLSEPREGCCNIWSKGRTQTLSIYASAGKYSWTDSDGYADNKVWKEGTEYVLIVRRSE